MKAFIRPSARVVQLSNMSVGQAGVCVKSPWRLQLLGKKIEKLGGNMAMVSDGYYITHSVPSKVMIKV